MTDIVEENKCCVEERLTGKYQLRLAKSDSSSGNLHHNTVTYDAITLPQSDMPEFVRYVQSSIRDSAA